MGERTFAVAPPDCSDRRNLAFFIAKTIAVVGHHLLVRAHVEMSGDVVALRQRERTVYLYCGLHKSLWEASGALAPLYLSKLPVPYVGMGDNLVKGRLFESLSKKIGTFMVRRPSSRRDMLESARQLRDDVLSFLAYGYDVMLFPEGTRKNVPLTSRYGDFFPAAFDAVLEYGRNRDGIVAATPGLEPRELHIVPFNVDYTRVREAREMVDQHAGRPQTLHVFDSLSMLRSIGDTYLSYGAPIPVSEVLRLNRKDLAALVRQRCLDLVKVLPVNVASRAVMDCGVAPAPTRDELRAAVGNVVERLRPVAARFRGFAPTDDADTILSRAGQGQVDFRRVDPEREPVYRLYSSYIDHYLSPQS